MRRWLIAPVALVLSGLAVAQEGDPDSAKAVYDRLEAELQRQNTAWLLARKTNRNAARPDRASLGKEAVAAAARFEGDDRVLLLGWAASNSGDREIIKDVVARLSEDHIDSPALSPLLENAMAISRPLGAEASGAFLRKVIAESPHAIPRAWSMYWMSVMMTGGRNVPAERKEAAAKLLAEAEKLAEGHWLADKIRGPEFKAKRLQTGMVAPDIVGEDVDGVPFKLSDYRGKVVVLDFWGFW